MRTNWHVPALSLAVVLVSCSKPQEPAATISDDLKRDLAAASATDLAPAQKSYERARFVSPIEQTRPGTPARTAARTPAPVVARAAHAGHDMTEHAPAAAPAAEPAVAEAVATLEAEAPATVATPTASAPAPSEVIVQGAPREPEPIRVSVGRPGTMIGDDGVGGLGGLIGASDGIAGAVIRGGGVGEDKCDRRAHAGGRPAMPTSGRPTFRMPSFPGGRR
jgi:hypothetical protein